MNALLVGGTGLLSSAVAAEARRRSIHVTMLTRGRRPVPSWAESIVCDCRAYGQLAARLAGRKFDAVVDFLCYRPEQLRESFALYARLTRQYVFISSYAVYDTTRAVELDEGAPKGHPTWQYGANKWACEQMLAELSRDGDCRYTVVRPAVTYGDTRIPYGVMPKYGWHWTLPARILAGKPVLTWHHGENFVNMMHVDDFAEGVVGLLGNAAARDEAFNVCGDEVRSYGDVLDTLAHLLGRPVTRIDVPIDVYARALGSRADTFLGGRCHDARVGNAKLKCACPGFRQKVTLAQGLARTLEAHRGDVHAQRIDWAFDGMTDRVCSQYGTACGFVDYLGRASYRDRIAYGAERYRDAPVRRALHCGGTVVRACMHRLERICHA